MTTPESPRSPWWLALRVFDEPTQVFSHLTTQPRALIPVLLMIVGFGCGAFLAPDRVIEQQAREQLEAAQARAPDRVTDELIQARIDRATSTVGRGTNVAAGVVIGLVSLTLSSLVLMLVFGAMSPTPITFKEEFAIVAHANMAQVLGVVLTVLLLLATGMDQLQLSLGFLFDRESSRFLYTVGTLFTFFGAWKVYLIALGNQVRTNAAGIGAPLAIVAGLWIVVNLLLAGLLSALAGMVG